MVKFWTLKNNKNVEVILIDDVNIYKGKIKAEILNHFSRQVEKNIIPEGLFSIPFSYITRIENQENKNKIKIYFGKESEEDLIFENKAVKKEVFDYLKENIHNLNYLKETPSLFKYAKPQIFAILFTLGIYLWSLYYAIEIENGVEYILEGRAGLGAIIYSIGLLGVFKVTLLFSLLLGISVYSLIRKMKSRSEIEQLKRRN